MSDQTGPLGGLPPADRTLLVRAPIELAVIEVRLLNEGSGLPNDAGLRLLELLGDSGTDFTRLDVAEQSSVSVELGPGTTQAPQVQVGMRGWQAMDDAGLTQVTLMPRAVAIQLQGRMYERWSVSLRPLFEAALNAVQTLLPPSTVGRIGLRYVDRFVDEAAKSPADWRGRIQDSLLGPICHPNLGGLIRGTQQQIELTLGVSQGAIVRHGPFADGAVGGAISYLLDIDVFDGRPAMLATQDIADRAEILNRTAASLFQQWMVPSYLHELQGRTDGTTGTDSSVSTGAGQGEPT